MSITLGLDEHQILAGIGDYTPAPAGAAVTAGNVHVAVTGAPAQAAESVIITFPLIGLAGGGVAAQIAVLSRLLRNVVPAAPGEAFAFITGSIRGVGPPRFLDVSRCLGERWIRVAMHRLTGALQIEIRPAANAAN